MSAASRRLIELTAEQEALLARLMASGAFGSESDAITASLAGLSLGNDTSPHEGDADFERFLREEVLPVYEEMQAHPERGIPIDEAFDWIVAPSRPRIFHGRQDWLRAFR